MLGAEVVDSVLDIDWLIDNILFTMLGAELVDSVLDIDWLIIYYLLY